MNSKILKILKWKKEIDLYYLKDTQPLHIIQFWHKKAFSDRRFVDISAHRLLFARSSQLEKIPGVDMSSSSLGQGCSAAVGIALSAKLRKKRI